MPATIFDLSEPVTVMTYNIKNGAEVAHWEQRRDALVRVIRGENPILFGTQEGFVNQLDYIRDHLPGYEYVGVSRYPDGSNEYNAIFYDTERVEPLTSGTFWLAETHDTPGSRVDGEELPRTATWVRCRVNGHDRDVVMVNTHLTYQDIGLAAQTASLVRGIDRIADHSLDVILTGDFNQPRHTPTWQTVTSAGFVDALDFAGVVQGPVFSFPDWDQWSEEQAATVSIENRIDWIMYRPGTGQALPDSVRLRVINTHTEPNPPSDHFPVVLSNRV